jgi:hypothetical protein
MVRSHWNRELTKKFKPHRHSSSCDSATAGSQLIQVLSVTMSTATAAVQPAERQDIHKSCRTIETLLNVLSDYCEAANAFTTIQKKLAKALRDAAGSKTNAQFAGEVIHV